MTPRRVRWRRWLIRLTLCLLLGAVTTVGVAWGIALWAPFPRLADGTPLREAFPFSTPESWSMRAEVFVDEARGITYTCAFGEEEGVWECQRALAFGWPMRSMYIVNHAMSLGDARGVPLEIRDWPTPRWQDGLAAQGGKRRLPTLLVTKGFAVNVFFYAGSWWVILVGADAINRWRRKRRGACLACGYDLRGLGDGAACPECGQAARGAARHRPVLSGDC